MGNPPRCNQDLEHLGSQLALQNETNGVRLVDRASGALPLSPSSKALARINSLQTLLSQQNIMLDHQLLRITITSPIILNIYPVLTNTQRTVTPQGLPQVN